MDSQGSMILPDRFATKMSWIVISLATVKLVSGGCAAAYLAINPAPIPSKPIPSWVYFLILSVFAGAGAVLTLGSRRDRAALFLGTSYLCIASAFSDRFLIHFGLVGPEALASVSRTLAALAVVSFFPAALWWFAGSFPRRGQREQASRVSTVAAISAAWICLALFLVNLIEPLVRRFGSPELNASMEVFSRYQDSEFFWTIACALAIGALLQVAHSARRSEPHERRRARLFLGGFLLAATPILIEIFLEGLIPPFAELMAQPRARILGGLIVYPLMLSFPITTTYAVLVDRVIDLGLVVRQAARYALARYTILAAAAIPVVFSLGYVYQSRDRTVAELLTGPGMIVLLVAGALSFSAYKARTPLLGWLDRQFYRESYDSRQILTDLAQRARSVESEEELAGLLVREIDRAFHLYSIAVLSIDRHLGFFVPRGSDTEPLPQTSTWVPILARVSGPIQVSAYLSSAHQETIDDSDRDWATSSGFEVLVPMNDSHGSVIGVIALGDKRSGLPVSKEDEAFLEAIASAGALALEVSLVRSSRSSESSESVGSRDSGEDLHFDEPPAKECSRCRTVWRPELTSCPNCGIELTPGRVPHTLNGKFRIEARIGQGGMGVVYRGQDLVLGRAIAIKTLPKLSSRLAERLRREARAMARVTHPNLAAIHGAESWNGTPLLVFEFLAGGTLSDRLRSRPLDVDEVLDLGVVLSDVLAEVHRANILHRDIKPSNIGFSAEGTPKLLDFGLARVLFVPEAPQEPRTHDPLAETESQASFDETLSETKFSAAGHLIGTPLYLSPEVLRGLPSDTSCDLWSLALTLYESLAGRNPFYSDTRRETYQKILNGEIDDIREYRSDCPAELSEFFRQTLHYDPKVRPATAGQFGRSLSHIHA